MPAAIGTNRTIRAPYARRKLGALLLCLLLLAGCYPDGGGGPVTSISLQPQLASLPAGSTQQFTATITNSQGHTAGWNLYQPFLSTPLPPAISTTGMGSITQNGLYSAPGSPPVFDYGGAAGIQGAVGVNTTAQIVSGQTTTVNADSGEVIVITAPAITAGFAGSTAVTVPLGSTYKFQPYAVGAVNRAYTLSVQGVTGGSAEVGTILQDSTNAGLYTAPNAVPASGRTLTVTVVSVADPTRSATATVTLR